ncbi:MAG: hypothetical protein KF841_06135 [Phycisphaerae bacterium]|nr:hypothetical protein [Phycisphaerae bacterium]
MPAPNLADMWSVPTQDEILTRITELVARTGGDARLAWLAAILPALAAVGFVVAMQLNRRTFARRLSKLEQLVGAGGDGPSVREFCAELVKQLRLKLPRARIPETPVEYETAFIRGLFIHLRARRRQRSRVDESLCRLEQELAELRDEVSRVASEATAPPASAIPEASTTQGPNELQPTFAGELSDEIDDAEIIAPDPELNAMLAEADKALPEPEPLPLPAVASAEFFQRVEEALKRIDELEKAWSDRSVAAAGLLVRIDDRIEELRHLLPHEPPPRDEKATDLIAPVPGEASTTGSTGEDVLETASPVEVESSTAGDRSQSAQAFSAGDPAIYIDSLRSLLSEAVLEEQRLTESREAAEKTRLALTELNHALSADMTHRQAIVARIDSQLRDRQIQLVTDIMRAETEHAELTQALSRITSTVGELGQWVGQSVPMDSNT